ncbi:MAG TPA: hypothetical protein VF414_05630 [Thermoanaerobaculia bacterium]
MATNAMVLLDDGDYSPIQVDRLLKQSEGRQRGHPGKHDLDKKAKSSSNPFAVLEDSDRPMHTLTSHDDQVLIVQTILNSKLGKQARAVLLAMFHRNIPAGRAKRIVLHATNLLQPLEITSYGFDHGEYKGGNEGKAATLVLEVLMPGRELHVQTVYAEDEIPQQATVLASGNDYFYLDSGSDPYSGGQAGDCVYYLTKDNKLKIQFFTKVGNIYNALETTMGKG